MTPAPAARPEFDDLDRADAQRRARLEAPNALANAALWYAERGWPIFPLRPHGKTPLTAHGFHDATTDADVVRTWWTTTPDANIGVATGVLFDVVDVDGPDGFRSLADLWHIGCPANCCGQATCSPDRTRILDHDVLAIAYTGGGGRHILIAPTGQANGAKLVAGIDYRGIGGYVVLPPSRHTSGGRYDWITAPDQRLAA